MGAVLQIVSQPSVAASVSKVFNESFVGRLATLNSAARALRDMGYRVVRQELNPARGSRPEIGVARGAARSIVPLLDRAEGRFWRYDDGKKRGYAEFRGVTVCWEDA